MESEFHWATEIGWLPAKNSVLVAWRLRLRKAGMNLFSDLGERKQKCHISLCGIKIHLLRSFICRCLPSIREVIESFGVKWRHLYSVLLKDRRQKPEQRIKKKLSELHLTFQLNADLTLRIQMCTCGVFKVCLLFYECK